MHKTKRGRAKTYDSDGLMFRSVMGVLLIALGVISTLSIVGGIQGTIFTTIKRIMQGLGGGLCLGIPLFLVSGGVLFAFSAYRRAPMRVYWLLLAIYFFTLGMINILKNWIN